MSRYIGEALCKRYIKEYPQEVLVAGIYGSYAKGEATPTSDLELVVLTRKESKLQERTFLINDLPVGVFVSSIDAIEIIVSAPSLRWPFQMGVLSILDVVAGERHYVDHLMDLGRAIPSSSFKAELSRVLPMLVWESWGRLRSCLTREDFGPLHISAVEVLMEIRDALCLLNRAWVTHDYLNGLRDSYSFDLIPNNWPESVEAIWWERAPERLIKLTDELVANFVDLMKSEEVDIPRVQSIDELKL